MCVCPPRLNSFVVFVYLQRNEKSDLCEVKVETPAGARGEGGVVKNPGAGEGRG